MATKKNVSKNTENTTKNNEEKIMEKKTVKKNEKISTKKINNAITIKVIEDGKTLKTENVGSTCRMWVVNKEIFKEHPNATLKIKGEKSLNKMGDTELELKLITKTNGQTWMEDQIRARKLAEKRIQAAAKKLAEKKAASKIAE